MKKLQKGLISSVAVVLAGTVLFTSIALHHASEVNAQPSFLGISTIVKNNSSSLPFSVVELVPDYSMAEFGYFIPGSEPIVPVDATGKSIRWEEKLASIQGQDARKNWMTGEKDRLAVITGNGKPLAYTDYEETYIRPTSNVSSWTVLDLNQPDELAKGTSGYQMKKVDAGKGDYNLSVSYKLVPEKTGGFDENPDYFVLASEGQSGCYELHFAVIEATETQAPGSDIKTLVGGVDAYEVKSAEVFMNADKFQDFQKKSANKHAAIYRVPLANLGESYTYVGICKNLYAEETEGVNAEDVLDFSRYRYFSVQFAYVAEKDLESGGIYYTLADDGLVFNTAAKSQYVPVLNQGSPYKVNADGTGYFEQESEPVYLYAGDGKGEYDLSKKSGAELDYAARLPKVYYKGGFSNNKIFTEQVFNQDNSLTKELYFDVTTMIPATLDDYLAANSATKIDLLYISAKKSKLVSSSASFSASNDISMDTVKSIAEQVYNEEHPMPVIVDRSILTSGLLAASGTKLASNFESGSTNLQKLVALLCATNYKDIVNGGNYKWSDLTLMADFDSHFVKTNVYVIPGNSASDAPYIMKEFSKKFITGTTGNSEQFETKADAEGFAEIAVYINDENFLRETAEASGASYERYDLSISKAIAVEYCVSYWQKRVQSWNHAVNVLDIEPCYTSASYTANLQTTILDWFTSKGYEVTSVTVTTVPMAEFIGRIDDLGNYDMLYFGLNTERFRKDGSGRTVYNDSNMNGLIYSNIGDMTAFDSSKSGTADAGSAYDIFTHLGLLETEYLHNTSGLRTGMHYADDTSKTPEKGGANLDAFYNGAETFRFTGNDITGEKMREVINFVKGGYPVIFDDGFLAVDSGKYKVNDDYLDNCSHVYEMVGGCLFGESEFANSSDKKFSDYTKYKNVMVRSDATSKTSLLFRYVSMSKPTISIKKLGTSTDVSDMDKVVELTGRQLTIDFKIANYGAVTSDITFDCMLYLDVNADGKYAGSERVAASELKITSGGVRQKTSGGKYALASGNSTYSLSYTLPESFIGIVPWKLKVVQQNNSYRYDLAQGYFKVKNTGGAKPINVLQLDTGVSGKSTLNMEENETFKNLLKDDKVKKDYAVSVKTVAGTSANCFVDGGVAYVMHKGTRYELDSFDMIVIGFADMYVLDTSEEFYQALRDYIDSGRPVLATHDITSNLCTNVETNNERSYGYWGYEFNTLLRNYIGMDRFGVLDSPAMKLGLTLTKGDSTKASFKEGSQTFYFKKNGDSYAVTTSSTGAVTYGELFDAAVKYAEDNDLDVAYLPRSNKTKIVRQAQGFTTTTLTKRTGYSGDYVNTSYLPMEAGKNHKMTTVKQVNSGQITNYPFVIGSSLTTAETHYQYYQLDMNEDADKDGESDIVVWYTLGDNNSNNLYGGVKDVRNSYYIYTKGNVTYSGVGHRAVTGDAEMKLYVNTLIAAYSAGIHPPTISLSQSTGEDAPTADTFYVAFDLNDNTVLESTGSGEYEHFPLYFTINDTNLVRNLKSKTEYVDFYVRLYPALDSDGHATTFDASSRSWINEQIAAGKCIEATDEGGTYYMLKMSDVAIKTEGGTDLKNYSKGYSDGWYEGGKYVLISGVTYSTNINPSKMYSSSYVPDAYRNKIKTYDESTGIIQAYARAYTKIEYDGTAKIRETDSQTLAFRFQQLDLVDLD